MSKKLEQEFVNNSFEKNGYTLTSKYINSKTKLYYICDKGHHNSMVWYNWQQGKSCPDCAGRTKPSREQVKQVLKKEKCTLASKTYINSTSKLIYICPEGHEHISTWANWQQGKRCSTCAGNKKLTIEFIRLEFTKEGYILISTKYVNAHTKLDYICPDGHKHSISWNKWQQGKRCTYCSTSPPMNLDTVRTSFEKANYTCLEDTYINSSTKIRYLCTQGHEGSITWDNWKQGAGCFKCNTSRFEQEIKEFILGLDQGIIENDRSTILNPNTNRYLELDILFPCKTKAIECNSIYWHSDPKIKEKDKTKKQQCKDKNIKLLIVDYEDWRNNAEKCKQIIKGFINE